MSSPNPTALKVLIVADQASAKFGGEAILPLHYFRRLRARGIEAFLITHARNRIELQAELVGEQERVFYVPDTKLHQWLSRLSRPLPGPIGFFTLKLAGRLLSQKHARDLARKLVRDRGIDVVHQPIPVSPKEPSLLRDLGAPLVVGPMNGNMTYPPGFRSRQGWWTIGLVAAGRLASNLTHRIISGKLRAATLLVANERTRIGLPGRCRGRIITLAENGVDLSLWSMRENPSPRDDAKSANPSEATHPTRLVYLGRLADWKGVDLLLDALAIAARTSDVTLEILGDGPMRDELEAQTERLNLGPRVRFAGWVAQTDCPRRLKHADILVLPSYHECGGAVVLEAMACGLPCIATDWGGPADYLDAECGVLVPPKTTGQFVNDLAAAIIRLANDASLRREMGAKAREKVAAQFDWDRKIDRILEIYRETIDATPAKP
jgi:glycosyltransferase involved in cell wall biosynthesis